MPFVEHGDVRLLYIHVPKTGGGTVTRWMASVGTVHFQTVGTPPALRCTPQHLRTSDFRGLFGPGYFTHTVMTVRNPFDRIASEYRMRAAIGGAGFFASWPTFSLWLENTLASAAKQPFHLDNHLRPQWEFLGTGVEVMRYEDGLPAIIARMAQRLQVQAPDRVERVHETASLGIDVEWDRVDRLRVVEFFRRDFTEFGYDPL